MQSEYPIVIAGGGPVGLVTALALARQGLDVHLLEAEARIDDSPRAATTHAATLEMLDGLGVVEDVIRQGLIEPKFRIWDRASRELIVEFDFASSRTIRATRSSSSASSTSSPISRSGAFVPFRTSRSRSRRA